MERSHWLLFALIATFTVVLLVQAQDQQGFISLDCGLNPNEPSPYNESLTGLRFSSDEKFIKRGKIGKIQANMESEYLKPYRTLRYFPDGLRNCYTLSVEKGRKYLIRAWFIYGNYDGLDIKPIFELYLGPNRWATIDLERRVNGTRTEMLHIPISNSLQICLVKNGTTTPLISALELRPIRNDSYITKSGSLNIFFRIYLSNSEIYLRYPDDIYDRRWISLFDTDWTQISTGSNAGISNDYDLPNAVIATAATPSNASAPLKIEWDWRNLDDEYYAYMHFAEIQELHSNDTREFNMVWNGEVMSDPVTPQKLGRNTIPSLSPRTCKGTQCSFQLISTNRSILPPILNAFEVYTVIQFPQSETKETDVVAIKSIGATYGLSIINWQGDPCVPRQFKWDGLKCSNTEMSIPPRITSLNLSSSGLTGTIAAGIQNLTQLNTLDLSNNNLTGKIPEFLGNMESLLFINISGNDLSGSIPQSLQRKGLELFAQGNPRLCLSGLCEKQKFPIVIVALVASVAILTIAVLVLIFVFSRKQKPSL